MALTPAEKQHNYRERQRIKLAQEMDTLRKQAQQQAQPAPASAAPVDAEPLPKTAQQKLDRAIAKEKAALAAEFDRCVRETADAKIPERIAIYEEAKRKADIAEMRFLAMSSGIAAHITQEDYRVLRSFFHTDKQPTDEQKNKAFNIVKSIGEYVKAVS